MLGEWRVEVRVAETSERISVDNAKLGLERDLREHNSSECSTNSFLKKLISRFYVR